MEQRARYTQALQDAARTLGGYERLAALLNVRPQELAGWLAGEEMPPLEAFLGSLDVIADGPYAPRAARRRVRVAAIRQR
jgi:hypothetical protein